VDHEQKIRKLLAEAALAFLKFQTYRMRPLGTMIAESKLVSS
jgi:hypothetical protein